MFLSAEIHPEARFALVFDASTGAEIPLVSWCDDETGYFGQFRTDERGRTVSGPDGAPVVDIRRAALTVRFACGERIGHG